VVFKGEDRSSDYSIIYTVSPSACASLVPELVSRVEC
jgi:hypothetical protein